MKFIDVQELEEEQSSNDLSIIRNLRINPYDIKIISDIEGRKPIKNNTINDLSLIQNIKETNVIFNNTRNSKGEFLFETVIDELQNELENEITNWKK